MTNTSTIDAVSASDGGARTHRARTAGAKADVPAPSRAELVLKKLRAAKGTTLVQLTEATGWQTHSVRGFLSGTVKKKLGLNLVSDVGKDGVRRYRVVAAATVKGDAS